MFSSYLQGNLFDFLRLTGWRGSKVLYFGDHLYSDLAVSKKRSLGSQCFCVIPSGALSDEHCALGGIWVWAEDYGQLVTQEACVA